jgi:hypothetical protein
MIEAKSYIVRCRSCSATVVFLLAALLFASPAQAATASWSLTPSSYDFGTRLPGTGPSVPAVFTLTNTGEVHLPLPVLNAAYSTVEGEPEPGPFEGVSDQCEGGTGLAPSASCTIEVTFDPHYPGLRTGSITLSDPSSQVAPVSVFYSGVGLGPIVSFSPPLLSLGSLLLGEGPSLPKVLTVSNGGDTDLSITAISFVNIGANPNHFAIVGGSCHPGGTVAPGAGCTIQLAFSPIQVGFLAGELQIGDNAAHGFQLVRVEGIGAALLATKPAPLATFISQRPRQRSTRRFATFRFGVAGVHAQFVCKLDRRPFHSCVSPTTYRNLPFGHHVFRVKTRSRTPGISPAPAVARFQVIPRQAG